MRAPEGSASWWTTRGDVRGHLNVNGCRNISSNMRTTVRINDSLLKAAKREAARRGQTLSSLIEQGLRHVLAQPPPVLRRVELPVCRAGGGTLPGIGLNDTSALMDVMDGLR